MTFYDPSRHDGCLRLVEICQLQIPTMVWLKHYIYLDIFTALKSIFSYVFCSFKLITSCIEAFCCHCIELIMIILNSCIRKSCSQLWWRLEDIEKILGMWAKPNSSSLMLFTHISFLASVYFETLNNLYHSIVCTLTLIKNFLTNLGVIHS